MWSNNYTGEDLINVSAGTYTLTVTDDMGCTLNSTSTVNNVTNGLAISNSAVVNDSCGQFHGSVNLSINGGSVSIFILVE